MLQLNDANGLPRAVMQVSPAGHAVCSLLAANGSANVGLGSTENDEVSVGITRPPGIPVLRVHWDADGGLQVEVWSQSEPPVVHHVVLPG